MLRILLLGSALGLAAQAAADQPLALGLADAIGVAALDEYTR